MKNIFFLKSERGLGKTTLFKTSMSKKNKKKGCANISG